MATQRKVGSSLNDERQQKLDEMLREEPFVTPSSLLAHALDVMYRVWIESGRDLKAALHSRSAKGLPHGGVA